MPSTALRASVSMSAADAALLRGAQTCSVAACKLALSQGASPDARDEDGDTALGCAAYEGSLELACVLLDAGASLEVVNRGGKTPLAQAAYSSSAKSGAVVREAPACTLRRCPCGWRGFSAPNTAGSGQVSTWSGLGQDWVRTGSGLGQD